MCWSSTRSSQPILGHAIFLLFATRPIHRGGGYPGALSRLISTLSQDKRLVVLPCCFVLFCSGYGNSCLDRLATPHRLHRSATKIIMMIALIQQESLWPAEVDLVQRPARHS